MTLLVQIRKAWVGYSQIPSNFANQCACVLFWSLSLEMLWSLSLDCRNPFLHLGKETDRNPYSLPNWRDYSDPRCPLPRFRVAFGVSHSPRWADFSRLECILHLSHQTRFFLVPNHMIPLQSRWIWCLAVAFWFSLASSPGRWRENSESTTRLHCSQSLKWGRSHYFHCSEAKPFSELLSLAWSGFNPAYFCDQSLFLCFRLRWISHQRFDLILEEPCSSGYSSFRRSNLIPRMTRPLTDGLRCDDWPQLRCSWLALKTLSKSCLTSFLKRFHFFASEYQPATICFSWKALRPRLVWHRVRVSYQRTSAWWRQFTASLPLAFWHQRSCTLESLFASFHRECLKPTSLETPLSFKAGLMKNCDLSPSWSRSWTSGVC